MGAFEQQLNNNVNKGDGSKRKCRVYGCRRVTGRVGLCNLVRFGHSVYC